MIKISSAVQNFMENDDVVKILSTQGLLNHMAYARKIQTQVENQIHKKVKIGSIAAAITRYIPILKPLDLPSEKDIQQISLHTNLQEITYERTQEISQKIQTIYNNIKVNNKTYITITQGINEITIIAEASVVDIFKKKLHNHQTIYNISNIVGITVKFDLKYLSIPNLFYLLIRKLALKNIVIVEIVSTATEFTFIVNKKDLQVSLDQLQKGL